MHYIFKTVLHNHNYSKNKILNTRIYIKSARQGYAVAISVHSYITGRGLKTQNVPMVLKQRKEKLLLLELAYEPVSTTVQLEIIP